MIRATASSISCCVVEKPRLKRTDDRKVLSGTAHGDKRRRSPGRSARASCAERNGDSSQVKLHQESVAVAAHEAEIHGLRKSEQVIFWTIPLDATSAECDHKT